jgi:hypothetical protein
MSAGSERRIIHIQLALRTNRQTSGDSASLILTLDGGTETTEL